ncbi:hypothetical protein BD560DRAFT_399553 [Blakeslea trispora]|nr:hypothetical protein BD560DRAFT_399553 [Blakeslea trispora]
MKKHLKITCIFYIINIVSFFEAYFCFVQNLSFSLQMNAAKRNSLLLLDSAACLGVLKDSEL